jgi:hypothetical protein
LEQESKLKSSKQSNNCNFKLILIPILFYK